MMFASKTPRDLNRDPHPYRNRYDGSRWTDPGVDTRGTTVPYDPRPEFDHVQHNAPNPILVEFRSTLRNYGDKRLCLSHYIEYVTYGDVYGWGYDHRFHAAKVLTRLATLGAD